MSNLIPLSALLGLVWPGRVLKAKSATKTGPKIVSLSLLGPKPGCGPLRLSNTAAHTRSQPLTASVRARRLQERARFYGRPLGSLLQHARSP